MDAKKRPLQKEIVLQKWDELVQELSIYLDEVRKGGGTMGHKVGSIRDQQIRLRKLFNDL